MAHQSRLPDWRQRFTDEIEAARHRPFEAGDDGAHNCIMWPARVGEAITGHNFVADYPSEYDEQLSQLQAEGGLRAAMASRLGASIHPARARRGDVGLVRNGDGLALGVIDPPYAWCAGPTGLERLDMSAILKAYRVG